MIRCTNYFIKTLALSKKESRIGFRKLKKHKEPKMNIFTKSNHLTAKAKKAFNGIDPISDCAARVYFMDSARADLICEMLESMDITPRRRNSYVEFSASGVFIEFVCNEVFYSQN